MGAKARVSTSHGHLEGAPPGVGVAIIVDETVSDTQASPRGARGCCAAWTLGQIQSPLAPFS
jgi:hypothetical protein